MLLNPKLQATVELAKSLEISEERKKELQELIRFIQKKKDLGEPILLNFICTHNSRRSQFAQVWAKTISWYMGVTISSFSGGVEITAFNDRAVSSLQRAGFQISRKGETNPLVSVNFSEQTPPITAFSKVFDDDTNPREGFAAVMTCSHADENCPYIAGAEERIPVRYEDPKEFDDTVEEARKYDERSLQIASEMIYVFSNIK